MNGHFLEAIGSLEPSFQRLLAMAPVTPVSLPQSMPASGIYLLSENNRHLYVGRTRNIRARIAGHSRPGATHGTAAFAFRLAREVTGNLAATYRKKGSRADLMESPEFSLAFDEAKKRILAMDLRFVEENDPVRQAVLEIYVAVSLQTLHNDFDTH
ncbi:MAG: GIY-YIG nuclease family protein [candidate division Zixibacteria bacterium]|nr:GIY-YIG nuclease family protein [candidate division Zixibacteria bacterium]